MLRVFGFAKSVALYPIQDNDPPEVRHRKMMFTLFYAVITVACGFTGSTTQAKAIVFACYFLVGCTVIAAAHLFITRTMTLRAVEVYVSCVAITGFVIDYATAASGSDRFWPGFVIVVDMLLVCRVRDIASQMLVGLVIVWLSITALESSFRYGLYDLGGSFSTQHQKDLVDCDHPPCANGIQGIRSFMMYSCVFLLDFYFTRGFSKMVTSKNRKMQTAIYTAQTVAKSLAAFDLNKSRVSLQENPDLPPELTEAFMSILTNLETYREFLPQSCLPFDMDDLSSLSASEASRSGSSAMENSLENSFSPFHMELKKKKVTLLVSNMEGTLQLLDQPEVLIERHVHMLSSIITLMKDARGVIDTFVGDHTYTSFNAARTCTAHSDAAIAAGLRLVDCMKVACTGFKPLCNVGIASGRALCGDMGCTGMKRYTIFGTVSKWVSVVERLGADWGVTCIVDAAVKADSFLTYPLRLLERRVLWKSASKATVPCIPYQLWEVVGDTAAAMNSEWMYEVDANTVWEQYNKAVDAWVSGHTEAALSLCTQFPATSSSSTAPQAVINARFDLAQRIRTGASPVLPTTVQW